MRNYFRVGIIRNILSLYLQIIAEKFYICAPEMEVVAQQVRASDCGSEGRGFEPRLPPKVLLRIGTIPIHTSGRDFFYLYSRSLNMKKLVVIFYFLSMCACQNPEKKDDFASSIVADSENEQALESSLEDVKKEEAERNKMLSTVGFDRMLHDFGSIGADADYTTSFTIKNTGKKPLLIYEVKASCGCTVPIWNKKPIAPGASDQIEVTFHPGKSQLGQQDKTISVITNTSPGVAVLQLKAFVNPKK